MKILKTALAGVCTSFLLWSQMPAQQYYNTSCCDPCCGPSDCCDQFWVDAEYLYWTIKETSEHTPLVITGPAGSVLDGPGTTVLLGDEKRKHKWRSGFRGALGYWFDECRTFGAEVEYFILPDEKRHKSVSSSGLVGSDFLFVPFINAVTGLPAVEPIAVPGVFAGTATLKDKNRMQGAELNGLYSFDWGNDCCNPCCDPCCDSGKFKFVGLAGFRWWNFDERLSFTVDSPFVPPLPADIFITRDKFRAENNFYGGQIGLGLDYNYCDFLINVKAKIALGAMREELKINGDFVTNDFTIPPFNPTLPETFVGGIFAEPTNIGNHKHTQFAWIPEVDVNLGYQITECFRVKVGYTFLYVSKVLRAGNAIDPVINPSQSVSLTGNTAATLVGVAAPLPSHNSKSFWAQGLNVGFEFSF